jgi:RNA polymerase sigma-70 factor, ECF subfamily
MDDGSGPAGREHERRVMGELLARFQERIYGYALRMVHDPDSAWDVMQETFLAASRALRAGNEPFVEPIFESKTAQVRAWLFQTAYNQGCTAFHKRQQSLPIFEPEDWRKPAVGSFEDQVLDLLAVQQAMATLKPDVRAAIELKIFDGYKVKEIAEIVGDTPATVQQRLYRGMAQLRTLLDASRFMRRTPANNGDSGPPQDTSM